MKKKGFRSVRRNKRRTVQTGGGHTELINSILFQDLGGIRKNIADLQLDDEKNAKAGPNDIFPFAVGRTALYLACRLPIPNPEIVKLLLANGFDPNSRNNDGATKGNGAFPLHGVVESIKDNIVQGVDISDTSSSYLAIITLLKNRAAALSNANLSRNKYGNIGMTAYDEYEKYVKPTTQQQQQRYRQFDVDLNNALFPYLQSFSIMDDRGAWIYDPAAAADRMRPAYGAAAVRPTGSPQTVVWQPPPGPPPTGSHGQAPSGITIQRTQSLTPGYSSRNDTGIDPKNAFVLCPSLSWFQRIGGKCNSMRLDYNGGTIQLPANGGDFNGVHLQVLARNETANVDGIMRTSLYGGVLSVEEIATIRCLVKNTTVVGITYPEKKGGYPQGSPIVKIPTRKPTIIVDQCGLQWQNSIYNTGALFFYPTGLDDTVILEGTDQHTRTTLGAYRKWQNDTYREMYGSPRPPVDAAADRDATWTANGQNIRGKLKNPVVGFKTEFMQAFHSVHFMADKEKSIKQVHFKFLRAGLGFFSENILLSDDTGNDAPGTGNAPRKTAFLETARLQGICEGIKTLGGAPAIMAHTKIKKIILPFQLVTIPQMESLNGYLLTSEEDALAQHPDPDVTIATTNCADPHAGPGNEGGYQSVDAAIGSNAYVHHLNAAFNYLYIKCWLFKDIRSVVPLVHVQPPVQHGSPFLPAAGAVYSPAAAAAAAAVDQTQTQDIRVQKEPGSAKWISAPFFEPQKVTYLWDTYLRDPTGSEGWNHPRPNDHIMIDPNSNKVMLKLRSDKEIGIMDVNDINVYLIGPSLPPQSHGQLPMEPGWYRARDYQVFAYLDFMYNNVEHHQSQGVTYFASANTDNDLRTRPQYRAIKNFDETTLNTQPNTQPVIFTMIRLPNGSICYRKNDTGRTQVMISGIPMEREAYTQELAAQSDAQLAVARQMWRGRQAQPQPPQPQPPLPGSPLPMAVAAPMPPIRTPYLGQPAPAGSPPFPAGLMTDVEAGNDRACVICQENKANLKFMPCSHCIICIECYINPNNTTRSICPFCRGSVTWLALCDEGGAEYQPPPPGTGYRPPPPGAGQPPPPGAGQPPPPDSPRGQRGCVDGICNWMVGRHPKWSRALRITRRGGKNRNRKQQKLQKQQKQRATRKHKNKKQSRRRGQRQPRHIRGRGSRKSSYKT